jgi:hypothetical protein
VAAASEVVVTLGKAFTTMASDLVDVAPLASVTFAVKVSDVAAVPTVPAIAPVEELSVSPVGKIPEEMLQARGLVPPVDVNVLE